MDVGFSPYAEGSCYIKQGNTHIHVTATVDVSVPRWMKGTGSGWVTAEYAMLPRSGKERNRRPDMRPNGRSMEIQRLIGRCLRTVVDLDALGERTITIDCDAIQADGGTRCASITAGCVALRQALNWMMEQNMLKTNPMKEMCSAISVGVVSGVEVMDLDYREDSTAHTDMNVVMTESGKFIEIQGTAEQAPFGSDTLAKLLGLASKGVQDLTAIQKAALEN